MVSNQLVFNGLNLDIFNTLLHGLLLILTSVINFQHIFRCKLDKKSHRTERYHLKITLGILLLHKKWSFPLRICSVNVTKYAENCGLIKIQFCLLLKSDSCTGVFLWILKKYSWQLCLEHMWKASSLSNGQPFNCGCFKWTTSMNH